MSADVYRLDVLLSNQRKARLVLRVHGPHHSGHPAALEFALGQALAAGGIPVPKMLAMGDRGQAIPTPWVLMEFVAGSSTIDLDGVPAMAAALHSIHTLPIAGLPQLPERLDPLEDLFEFFPKGSEWLPLKAHLKALSNTAYEDPPVLLHGDFWPENLLWERGALRAVLDWEDAALGDPLSDLAASRLELRYRFGTEGMEVLTERYEAHRQINRQRLWLWQFYVAAAAARYMGDWRLAPELEAHMRRVALQTLTESTEQILNC